MKNEDIEKLTNSIRAKLGDETSALISDDLANIILDNQNMNTAISSRDSTISELQKDKDNLIMTNNRLFQQVSIGEEPKLPDQEPEKKPFNFRSVFDEKGNFIE